MNSLQRVIACLDRTGLDRLPVHYEGVPEVTQTLHDVLGTASHEELLACLGDDFRTVEAPYVGPELRRHSDGSQEGIWGERYRQVSFGQGQYNESVFKVYAGIESVEELAHCRFPSPDWYDFSHFKAQCAQFAGQFALSFGEAGDLDFINGISNCLGMEAVLLGLITDEPVLLEILQRRFAFFYELHRRALQSAGGLLHFSHIGEDLGNQRGPMISLEIFERHLAPRYAAFFDMVHSFGARVKMHMCGCVHKFLPRLIELGLDLYDVVQPTTPEMEIERLQREFGARLAFSGSLCVQTLLPNGSVEEIRQAVARRVALFRAGGLVLGPTHAIQVGTPVQNILALYAAAGSLDPSRLPATLPVG